MKEILKRLEIVKSSIILEDEETLNLQINKLQLLNCDDEVNNILFLIHNTDFEKVIKLIDLYSNKFSSLIVYEDEEIQGLKIELKILEKEFLQHSNRVEEYHNIINDFNTKYHKTLGKIIEEILLLREEYYEYMYKNTNKYEYEYFESKNDFENFHEEFKKFSYKDSIELSKEEKQELKKLYKKASRLCHPDILEDDKKEKAEEIFKELNAAYEQKNILKVKDILEQLLSGESFCIASDTLFDKNILKRKINSLRDKIRTSKLEISSLKQNQTFIKISKIDDIFEYFSAIKEELLEEKESILSKIKKFEKKY